MKWIRKFVAAGSFLLLVAGPAQAQSPRMAITFDDLPAHGPLPPAVSRSEVAQKIVDALRAARVPQVYGLVNAQDIQQHPEDADVLRIWTGAGFPLGNHTWSHMNLNQNSLAEFEKEIEQNETVLRSFMGGRDWHWFRFPYLAEGDTAEKRSAIRKYLSERGYKIAAVTMSFGDYQWNEPYARCKAKEDANGIALLESSYLSAAEASIDYARNSSQKLYGRDIPYVLLMHIGAFDAVMLTRLLELYRERGFRFVPLPEAERDAFYRVEIHPQSGQLDTLEAVMAEKHITPPPFAAPAVQFDALCR